MRSQDTNERKISKFIEKLIYDENENNNNEREFDTSVQC